DALRTYDDVGGSGRAVRRQFCGNCGSQIVSATDAAPDVAFIKAGTLDDTSSLMPTMEIWCETAQPWVKLDGARQQVGRNPPLAAYPTPRCPALRVRRPLRPAALTQAEEDRSWPTCYRIRAIVVAGCGPSSPNSGRCSRPAATTRSRPDWLSRPD